MEAKLIQFYQWLEQSSGSFKGAPIPNYVNLLLWFFIIVQIVLLARNMIKKKNKTNKSQNDE